MIKIFAGFQRGVYWGFPNIHRVGDPKEKVRNPLHPNQNWATFCPLSWSCNLSAIRAMNSELVGLPLVLDTV